MVQRVLGADTFTLLYDGSLRMVGVRKNGATIAEFAYDGDGSRSTPAAERRERMVTASVGGVVTSYVGGYFEWQTDASGSAAVKYYSAGSARVAMRKEGVVTYLFGDHLGSTSVTFNDTGNTRQRQGYTAFGEERYPKDDSIFPTDYEYTGQKEFEKIGLQYYGARWYDSALGRFTQADSIIPQPGNPLAWDRFAYTLNNPVRYKDSSGHCIDGISTWACLLALVGVVTKAIDYGWTAYDTLQSVNTLNDVNASSDDKLFAGVNVALASTEFIEPDDVLPVGLPADDLARRGILKAARQAYQQGGKGALFQLLRNSLGDQADTIIKKSGLWGQIAETRGLQHSFSEHASQWFGRKVSSTTHMEQWQTLIQQAAKSSKMFQWSVGGASTTAHLAYIDGKWFVVQFFNSGERAGELATAFIPNQNQLDAMMRLLEK